jgi:type VI secretion system secreted protein Hcp
MKATIKNSFAALVLPACAALALLGATTSAEAGAFLKIQGIEGESTDAKHDKWIEVLSMSSPIFRAPVTDPATGVSRRRGDVIMDDITCAKELDKSSPKIAEALCNGTFYDEVEIHFTVPVQVTDPDGTVRTEQEPYLIYKLKDVIVTSYSFHGNAAGDPLPTEEITLGYTEVEWTYVVLDPAGVPTETIIGQCGGTPGTP